MRKTLQGRSSSRLLVGSTQHRMDLDRSGSAYWESRGADLFFKFQMTLPDGTMCLRGPLRAGSSNLGIRKLRRTSNVSTVRFWCPKSQVGFIGSAIQAKARFGQHGITYCAPARQKVSV